MLVLLKLGVIMSLLLIPKGSKPISDAQKVCRARCMLIISMMLSEMPLADDAGTDRLRGCQNEGKGQSSWNVKKGLERCMLL